ncbi:MAG: RHS repeat-associated core domain-containing protein [bacterium]
MKDHLGNVWLTFVPGAIESVTATQRNNYYPFGTRVALVESGTPNKYLYNSKELNDENGLYWYHYGARFYDPQLGRCLPGEVFFTETGHTMLVRRIPT